MITTTHGLMDEARLRRVEGELDNSHEHTKWVEYYLADELVHRSVHVHLKEGIGIEAILGGVG